MHTPSVNQTREGVPEYVEQSTVLKEVYAALPDEVRRELDETMRELGIRALARVYVEHYGDDIEVYVLLYEVAYDGAEWITIVTPKAKVDFRVVEGIIWIDGEKYLVRDYGDAVGLARQILRDIAWLRNGWWEVGAKAEEHIEEFRKLLGEPL